MVVHLVPKALNPSFVPTFDVELGNVQLTLVDVTSDPIQRHRLTASFTFSSVKYTYRPVNPDGTPGTEVVTAFDLAQGTGGGATSAPLNYVVAEGTAPAPGPQESLATGFSASIVMVGGAVTGGGGGAGKPQFSQPSVIALLDGNVIAHLSAAGSGTVLPSATVRLVGPAPTGESVDQLRYDFQNPINHIGPDQRRRGRRPPRNGGLRLREGTVDERRRDGFVQSSDEHGGVGRGGCYGVLG